MGAYTYLITLSLFIVGSVVIGGGIITLINIIYRRRVRKEIERMRKEFEEENAM